MQVVLLGAALACISPTSSLPQGSATDTRIVNIPPPGHRNPSTSAGHNTPQRNPPVTHGATGNHGTAHGNSPIPQHNNFQSAASPHRPVSTGVPGPTRPSGNSQIIQHGNFQGAGPVLRPMSTGVPGPPRDPGLVSTPNPQGQDAERPGTLLMPNGQVSGNTRPPQSSDQTRHPSCGIFPSPGECQAAFPRYFYNKTSSQCDCYLYGGCDEGLGSYRTLEECHRKCLPDDKDEGPYCDLVYIDNVKLITPSPTAPTTRKPNKRNGIPSPPTYPSNERPEGTLNNGPGIDQRQPNPSNNVPVHNQNTPNPSNVRPGRPSNNVPAHNQHTPNPSNVRPGGSINNGPLHHQQPSSSSGASSSPGRPINGRRPIPNPPLFPTEVSQKPIALPQNPVRPTRRPAANRQPTPSASLFPSNAPGGAITPRPIQQVTNQQEAVGAHSIPDAPVYPTGNTQIKPSNTPIEPINTPGGFSEEDTRIPDPPLFPTEVRRNQTAKRPGSSNRPQSNRPQSSRLPAGSGSTNPNVISTITEVDFPDSNRDRPIPVGIPIPDGTPSGGVFPNIAFPDADNEPMSYGQDMFPDEAEYGDDNSGIFIA